LRIHRAFKLCAVATGGVILSALLARHAAVLLSAAPSTEVAAWVQAIGSIAAIIAAFLISWLQLRHERQRNIRHDTEMLAIQLRSLLYILESISSSCLRLNRKLLKPEGIWRLEAGYLEMLLRDLRQIPNQDIPSAAVASRVHQAIELLNGATYFLSILDKYDLQARRHVQRTLRNMLTNVFNSLVECSIEIGGLAASRGIEQVVIDGMHTRNSKNLDLMRRRFIADMKTRDDEISKLLAEVEAIAEHPDSEDGSDSKF
jgi:hypothetical protein